MIFLNVILTVKASTPAVAKPGCQSRCGDVIIPYPFGTGGDCNITEQFLITCNTSYIPNKAFLGNGNLEVINISTDGQLRIFSNASYDCYNTSYRNWSYYRLQLYKFSITITRISSRQSGVTPMLGWKVTSDNVMLPVVCRYVTTLPMFQTGLAPGLAAVRQVFQRV
ncbi:hypothetical protein Gohar_008559 [Gossypium harknessii]|uniref:Wall-associated receptor kinase galacturonan-binding domain-containing protein n=1 Tax=Gossypium harknessii TaxID=34285 RepID=A0A7J9GK32_9ROSI|nr:hypothetical protein [Gossypium harknessii]